MALLAKNFPSGTSIQLSFFRPILFVHCAMGLPFTGLKNLKRLNKNYSHESTIKMFKFARELIKIFMIYIC